MVLKRQITLGFIFILLCAFAQAVSAQGPSGQISGTVIDPQGAVVPGAAVKAVSVGQAFERTATTNNDGEFAFSLLPPGRYRVEVTASGFAAASSEIMVNVTQTTPVEFTLSVQGATGVVNVESPAVQTESSQNGGVVQGDTIRQLPLPSRNFQQILTLSAGAQSGVTNTTDLGRGDAIISVNGQRTTSNSVKINGIDANSVGTNSTPNIAVPSTESLQEFVVQTSLYDASNGRNAGGNVEAITRSGTNDFHGSAFYFFRDKALNANDPFIKARGLAKPIGTRNQFGLTFGGPIIKSKAFIFGAYQGTREVNGVSLANSLTFPGVPAGLTDTNRTASGLSAAFGVPIANISPQALFILNAHLPNGSFAVPSSGVTGLAAGAIVTVPQSGTSRFRENQFSINGDFNISDKNTLSAKVFFADNPTKQANYNFAGLGNGNNQLIGFGGDLAIKQTLLSFTDTHIFGSGIVNQARFGFSRLLVTSVPEEPFTAAQLGIVNPLASLFPGAPTIVVAGGTVATGQANFTFGSSTLADQSSRINAFTFADTISWVQGNHRFRIGGEYRPSTVKFYFNAFTRGQLIYSSFNSFLTGTGTSILGSGVFDRSFRVSDLSGFIQDDYKFNDRLTFNLGLRYDYYGLPVDTEGRLVNFDVTQFRIGAPPNGIVQAAGGQLAGVPTVEKTLVPTDKNNFAPRLGFAYRVDSDGKIVVRGGYGIYYDRISTRYANTQLFNFPYLALGVGLPGLTTTSANPFVPLPPPSAFPTVATIPSVLSPLAPFVGVSVSGVFVDPELQTPYIQQYNLGVQWEFMKNTVLEAGYVGNRGTHLLQVITVNQPAYNPTTNSFAPPYAPGSVLSVLKNVTGGVQQVQTTSLSRYNSFQMTLSRRFNQGLQASAAYTAGRSIDYYSGGTINELSNTPGDQYNWRLNKGRSDFNREQRLVISGVYDLPNLVGRDSGASWLINNWQVAGIAVFQTGLPFSVIDNPGNGVISRSNFNTAFTGQLMTTGSSSVRTGQYFSTQAFAPSCPIGTVLSTNPALPPSQRFVCGTGGVGTVNNPFFDPGSPFGNTPRNLLTGPGQKNVDISFIKQFPVRENMKIEFRAEMFNVFNWVNYANPVNNRVLGTFGQITSAATGPRVIQFGAKISF